MVITQLFRMAAISLFNLKFIFLLYLIDECSNCMILNFHAALKKMLKIVLLKITLEVFL